MAAVSSVLPSALAPSCRTSIDPAGGADTCPDVVEASTNCHTTIIIIDDATLIKFIGERPFVGHCELLTIVNR